MVLQERIELSTSPLPRECSTTELLQPEGREDVGRLSVPIHVLDRMTGYVSRRMLRRAGYVAQTVAIGKAAGGFHQKDRTPPLSAGDARPLAKPAISPQRAPICSRLVRASPKA